MREIFIKHLKENGVNFDEGDANYIDDSFESVYEAALYTTLEWFETYQKAEQIMNGKTTPASSE